MFPSRYFPDRFFAPRYWPKVGSSVVITVGTLRFKLPPNRNVFTLPARMQKFPLPANENEFIFKEGGQQ